MAPASDNGHGATGDRVAAALRQSVRARTTADLSSRERSQLTDEMVMLLKAQTRQVGALTKRVAELEDEYEDHGTRIGALMGSHTSFTGRSFLARLRWLVRGC